MQILYRQRSLNSINKLLFDNFRVLNLYPKLLIFPLLLNFSIHSDLILSRCVIPFRFSDGVPLTFPNQLLFDEFQGITLNYFFMSAKLLKYDFSRFAIVRGSRFCACILTF